MILSSHPSASRNSISKQQTKEKQKKQGNMTLAVENKILQRKILAEYPQTLLKQHNCFIPK
jgi:hypothetical protein